MASSKTIEYVRQLFLEYPDVEFSSNGIQGILISEFGVPISIEEIQEALSELIDNGEVQILYENNTLQRYAYRDN